MAGRRQWQTFLSPLDIEASGIRDGHLSPGGQRLKGMRRSSLLVSAAATDASHSVTPVIGNFFDFAEFRPFCWRTVEYRATQFRYRTLGQRLSTLRMHFRPPMNHRMS